MRWILATTAWAWLAQDVWTFDDALPAGEGAPARATIDGRPVDVTGWTPEGYAVHDVVRIPETSVRPVIPSPYVRRFGALEVTVREVGDRLVATVSPRSVDVRKLGLTEGDGVVTTGLLAPFEVQVDTAAGAVLAQEVELPPGAFLLLPGTDVRWQGGEGRVIATEAGMLEVRSGAARVDPSLRLERSDDVEIPAGAVGLVGVGVVAGAGLAARRRGSRAGGAAR